MGQRLTGSKNTQLFYLISRFSFVKISSLKSDGQGKILQTSADSMGTLQIVALIFENSSFPCITCIFLN